VVAVWHFTPWTRPRHTSTKSLLLMDYSTEDVRMREAHDDDDDEDDDLDVEKAMEKTRRHLDDDDEDDDEDEDEEGVRAGSSRKTKVCATVSYG
jgi:hypothetical protein